MPAKKVFKFFLWILLVFFLFLNSIAFMHAYRFTHFSERVFQKTKDSSLELSDKVQILFTGVSNPKPQNKQTPSRPYQVVSLQSNKKIEGWLIPRDSAKGTVVLFHGYGGEKSSMLDKAEVFHSLGYRVLLMDFMGSGGSEGVQTTIGYDEAEQVKTSFEYLQGIGEDQIHLFGTSMGAVAIMKALQDSNINPSSIILECPFGTMYETVSARFEIYGVPSFPMAGLLLFWGGTQNGFWAFDHDPVNYAKSISCPVLLLYGERDPKVSRGEIDQIYSNLKGLKTLRTYPHAGHENYLRKYEKEWTRDVQEFLLNGNN